MSRLRRDRLDIWLAPSEVELTLRGASSHASRATRIGRRPGDPRPPMQWLGDTLARVLATPACRNTAARVLLSNAFVRYAVVPWQRGVVADADRKLLGLATLRGIYGERANGWAVAMSRPTVGAASLAGAIDTELVELITLRVAAADIRLDRIEPLYARAFDAMANVLPVRKELWFAVAEPGHLCVGMAQAGSWQIVRARAVRSRPAEELLMMLEQARIAGGVERPGSKVHVLVRGGVGSFAWPNGARWTAKLFGRATAAKE